MSKPTIEWHPDKSATIDHDGEKRGVGNSRDALVAIEKIANIKSSKSVELPERWALGWVGGKDTKNQPKSCFNCPNFYINQKRCQIIGPDIIIDSVVKDGQRYTPVCIYQNGGLPRTVSDSEAVYNSTLQGEKKADQAGLEWAKGPGTNCNGCNGGAPCKHFVVTDGKGVDGICDVMQKSDNKVDWDDCCDAHNGESIEWREAQKLLGAKKNSEEK